MRFSMRVVICAIVPGALAGCAASPFEGTGLGPPGAVETAIRRHYEENASENRGLCQHPYIDAVTRAEVVENRGERVTVAVRYFFQDEQLRPERGRGSTDTCQGFGVRTFTLSSAENGPEVVAMSGPADGSLPRALVEEGLKRVLPGEQEGGILD